MAEVASWTVVGLAVCSEEAEVETEAAFGEVEAWTEGALVEEEEEALGVLLDLSWSKWAAEEEGVAGPERWIKASIARSAETGPTRRRNPAELHLLPDLFFKPENVLNL